ncbi:MAG: excinuclease ABC subunit UvrC [Verrucomicrobiota bacterium]|jgi:excinuclease ABC subunit C|nr:excinuclease ABC subunit UvrC [Verrucomicrobiota bacterium]
MLQFSEKVRTKLAALPDKPGVYLMRNRQGRIIYIGKAASLRSRVSSYFRHSTFSKADPKIRGLIRSIDDFDFIELKSEAEATLTESRMIKDYRPRYNSLLKDDKRFLLIRVNLQDPVPRFDAVRIRKDDGARYWGPYASSAAAWASLEFIEKQFGLRRCSPRVPGVEDHKHCLNDVVRFCSAPCIGKVSPEEYHARVRTACEFLDGNRREYLEDLRRQIASAAGELKFEKAAALRDMYLLLTKGIRERARGRKSPTLKQEEARKGLEELQQRLGLDHLPDVIECYDISNISGTLSVASQVVSVRGLPAPARYRMYRIKTVEGADDPASMAEVIRRRFTRALEENERLPDLVMVDGGITQLRAARAELDALGLPRQRLVGIAKQFEELYHDPENEQAPLRFAPDSPALRVVQQIRDEAHRFALTYHRKLRARRIHESVLDDIHGIGERRKALLLKQFGSVARLKRATVEEIASAPDIGLKTAEIIHAALHPTPPAG